MNPAQGLIVFVVGVALAVIGLGVGALMLWGYCFPVETWVGHEPLPVYRSRLKVKPIPKR